MLLSEKIRFQLISSLRWSVIGLGMAAWSGSCVPLGAVEVEVRPQGPVDSLRAALHEVRKARAAGDRGPALVRVAAGTYRFSEPLVLEPQDSQLRIEAAPGARPEFLGSRTVGPWQVESDGTWVVPTGLGVGSGGGAEPFEAIWVGGKRAIRARTPNEGYVQAVGQPRDPVEGLALAGPFSKTLIEVAPGDASALGRLNAEEQRRVQVDVYHSWDMSRLNLAGVNAGQGKLQFTGGVRDFFHLEPWHRLKFENYRGAWDAPGEWFLETDGRLRYRPLPGELPERALVEIPVARQWLILKGDPERSQWVKGVEFRGLRFAYQNWQTPVEGVHAGQAASGLKFPAVEVEGVEGVLFENCEFEHTMTHALWARAGCSEVTVRHCLFRDLGAGGVYVGDPKVHQAGLAHTHHVTLEDSILRGGGRHFPEGIGVVLFHASDSVLRHCDIGDFYYSAVSIGWTWGYRPTVAGRNRVEFCHLHHLGWAVLSDMGAVYTLGSQLGTVIRNNHVHDIGCASYGGWGLYNDEGSTGVLWENNLVHHTQSAGYHQHYGRGNLVRNNILAWGKEEHLRRSKPEEALAFVFEKNIVLQGEGKLLTPRDVCWHDGRVVLADNVYWSASGAPVNFAGKTWEEWRAWGNDVRSVLADPLFEDAERGDWRLKPGSPALALGFVPFDWKQAGVIGGEAWRALAAEPLPAMVYGVKPVAPPLRVLETFEQFKAGERATLGRVNPNQPALYVVSGVPGAQGQCLELRDGPDQKPAFEPHFYYRPAHREGITRVSFDLRVEGHSRFQHEWRDGQTPYQSGVMFSVEKGEVKVLGRKLAGVEPLQWVHFEIESAIGESASGEWSLTLTAAGGQPQKFSGLKPAKGALKELQWLGFISPATEPAKAWLDNIRVENFR